MSEVAEIYKMILAFVETSSHETIEGITEQAHRALKVPKDVRARERDRQHREDGAGQRDEPGSGASRRPPPEPHPLGDKARTSNIEPPCPHNHPHHRARRRV